MVKTAISKADIRTSGDQVEIVYYLKVGKNSNGDVSTTASDYDAYGTIDLSQMILTDTIPAITDINGSSLYPNSISIKDQDGNAVSQGVQIYSDLSGFEMTEEALSVIKTDKVADGEVYSYGYYTVTLSYDAADFTYPLTAESKSDFIFKNNA